MDWDAAIEVQRTALQRLLAVMFGVIGAELGGSVDVVTRRVLLLVLRMLGPAESAARRLVFLRARHLPDAEIADSKARDKTKKRGQKKGRAKSRAFPLFDAQRRTRRAGRKHPKGSGPNIFFFDGSDTPPAQPKSPVMPYDLVDAAGLCQRLNALFAALGDLDKQALRLKRIEARRKPNPRFWGEAVVRPDTPPGHRKNGRSDNERAVDKILRECQDLALWWIAECDTS